MQSVMQPGRDLPGRSHQVVDCGYYGNDKDFSQEELIVKAEGRAITVPLGVTLLLHHVQKALQAELGCVEQGYDIYDMQGSRLRTDQDLREAVMAGRTPLSARSADSTARPHLDDQREELAHIICQLVRDQTTESDTKLSKVCRQVDGLKAEIREQKRELNMEFQALRKELFTAVDAIKDTAGSTAAGKVDLTKVGDSVPIAEKDLACFEKEFREGLHRLNDRITEMLQSVSNVISEHEDYLKRSCQSATQEVEAVADRCALLDVRVTKVERNVNFGISAGPPSNSDARSPRPGDSLRRTQSPFRMQSLASVSEASNRSPVHKPSGSPMISDIRAASVDSISGAGSTSGCTGQPLTLGGLSGKTYKLEDTRRLNSLPRSQDASSLLDSHGSASGREVNLHTIPTRKSNRSTDGLSPVSLTRRGSLGTSKLPGGSGSFPVHSVAPQPLQQTLHSEEIGGASLSPIISNVLPSRPSQQLGQPPTAHSGSVFSSISTPS